MSNPNLSIGIQSGEGGDVVLGAALATVSADSVGNLSLLPALTKKVLIPSIAAISGTYSVMIDTSGNLSSSAGGGSATWGSISGTIANQTDLQSEFSNYATTSSLNSYLPLAGGTLTGNLLFSADNTYNIGAVSVSSPYALSTRPSKIFAGLSSQIGGIDSLASLHSYSDPTLTLVNDNANANGARLISAAYGGSNNSYGKLYLAAARGSMASPTTLGTSDVLGQLAFRACNNTGTLTLSGNLATIQAMVSGSTFNNTSSPTYLSFQVTNTGATSCSEAMTLDANGSLGLKASAPNLYWGTDGAGTIGTLGGSSPYPISGRPSKAFVTTTFQVGGADSYASQMSYTDPVCALINDNANTNGARFIVSAYSGTSGNGYGKLYLIGSRGTMATPTPTQSGDYLGLFGFRGCLSSGTIPANNQVNIYAVADATFTSSAAPTHLSIQVCPTTTMNATEVIIIDNAGGVNMKGGTPNIYWATDGGGSIGNGSSSRPYSVQASNTIAVNGYHLEASETAPVNSGTSVTLDFSTASAKAVLMAGNCTATLSNCKAGGAYAIRCIGGSSAYTMSIGGAVYLNPSAAAPAAIPATSGILLINVYAISASSFLVSFAGNYSA